MGIHLYGLCGWGIVLMHRHVSGCLEISGCRDSVREGSLKFGYFVDLLMEVFLSISWVMSRNWRSDNVSVVPISFLCNFII